MAAAATLSSCGPAGVFHVIPATDLAAATSANYTPPEQVTIAVGQTFQFAAVTILVDPFGDAASQVIDHTARAGWISSNEAVASISNAAGSDGLATAKAPGMTTITATLSGSMDTITLIVVEPARLEATKTSSPTSNELGAGNETYTITVRNAGGAPASSVTLTDTVPSSMMIQSVTFPLGDWIQCMQSGQSVTCANASQALTPSSSRTVTIEVTPQQAGTFTNTATANFTGSTGPVSASATTTVTGAPDTSFTCNAPANVTAGSNTAFSCDLQNIGTASANGTTYTIQLSTALTPTAINCNLGSCNFAGQTANGTVDLAPGQILNIVLNTDVDVFAGNTTQTLQGSASHPGDTTPGNNSLQLPVPVSFGPTSPLSVTKVSNPPSIPLGQNVTYEITVVNTGMSMISMDLLDQVPASFTILPFPPSSGCTVLAGNMVRCGRSGLPLNNTQVFTITIAPTLTGSFSNTVQVSSDGQGPVSASAMTTVTPASTTLSITTTGPASVTAGQNIPYTITVTNTGANPANNVRVLDTLPPGTVLDAAPTIPANTSCTGPAPGMTGTLDCTTTDSLDANGMLTINFAVRTNSSTPTPVSNTASAQASNASLVFFTTMTAVNAAPTTLSITKTAPASVSRGQLIPYSIVVTNTGAAPANNVRVTDTLPPGTVLDAEPTISDLFALCTGVAPGMAGTLNCFRTLSLDPGEVMSIAFQVRTDGSTPSPVTNTAIAGADNADPRESNTVMTTLTAPAPALSACGNVSTFVAAGGIASTPLDPVTGVINPNFVTFASQPFVVFANAGASGAEILFTAGGGTNGATTNVMALQQDPQQQGCSTTQRASVALAGGGSSIAASGNTVFVGYSSSGGGVRVLKFDPVANMLSLVAGSPFSTGGSRVGAIAVHPAGTHLIALAGDRVLVFAIDPATGALTLIQDIASSGVFGLGPIRVAVNPAGDRVYLLTISPQQVASASFNSTTGMVDTSVITTFSTGSGATDMTVSQLTNGNDVLLLVLFAGDPTQRKLQSVTFNKQTLQFAEAPNSPQTIDSIQTVFFDRDVPFAVYAFSGGIETRAVDPATGGLATTPASTLIPPLGPFRVRILIIRATPGP